MVLKVVFNSNTGNVLRFVYRSDTGKDVQILKLIDSCMVIEFVYNSYTLWM